MSGAMLRYAIGVLMMVSMAGLAPSQDQAAAKSFAGTWEGRFKGTVFCRLKIENGSPITGTFRPGRISLNHEGDLTEAEPSGPDSEAPILSPKIEGAVLLFEWKEKADAELLRIHMKLTGEKHAEMQIEAPERMKPIRLERAD